MEISLETKNLFGGAITILIPSSWRDVSDVRQVPDHQEVFQDCTTDHNDDSPNKNEFTGTDGCIIIEILERQNDVSDDDAATFLFHDLAEFNSSSGNHNDNDQKKGSIEYTRSWSVGFPMDDIGEECDSHHNLIQLKTLSLNDKSKEKSTINIPGLSTQVKASSCIGNQVVPKIISADSTVLKNVKVELCVVRMVDIQTDLLISMSMPCDIWDEIFRPKIHDQQQQQRNQRGHSAIFEEVVNSLRIHDWSLFA
jgi:hypothetical protein